jgi:hypothetical protein
LGPSNLSTTVLLPFQRLNLDERLIGVGAQPFVFGRSADEKKGSAGSGMAKKWELFRALICVRSRGKTVQFLRRGGLIFAG